LAPHGSRNPCGLSFVIYLRLRRPFASR